MDGLEILLCEVMFYTVVLISVRELEQHIFELLLLNQDISHVQLVLKYREQFLRRGEHIGTPFAILHHMGDKWIERGYLLAVDPLKLRVT